LHCIVTFCDMLPYTALGLFTCFFADNTDFKDFLTLSLGWTSYGSISYDSAKI